MVLRLWTGPTYCTPRTEIFKTILRKRDQMKSVFFSIFFTLIGTSAIAAVGECQQGYAATPYGCMAQGDCPVGQYQYNNNMCLVVYPEMTYGGIQCNAGYVLTQYGCLAQGSCPAGQAQYNNVCVSNGYPYGSYPYGSSIYGYPYGTMDNNGYSYYYWYYYGY